MGNNKVHIIETARLDKETKNQVQRLWQDCREKEPVTQEPFLDGEENAATGLPCFYLCYEGERLTSFLSLFIPDGGYAEGYGFTGPQDRRKGYFSSLVRRAEVLTQEADIPLYLVSDRQSRDACAFIRRMGLEKVWEERMMEIPAGELYRLTVDYDPDAFHLSREEDWWIMQNGGKELGRCRLSDFQTAVYLYDFAIDEGQRRKGYGRLFLKLLGGLLDEEQVVLLQVGTYNAPACGLYEGCGFTVRESLSYYQL